jgi:hypothetical protein
MNACMTTRRSRRDMLRDSLAVTSLALLNVPDWVLPALAQGETVLPFADSPATFPPPGPVTVNTTSARSTARLRRPIVSSRHNITGTRPSTLRRSG